MGEKSQAILPMHPRDATTKTSPTGCGHRLPTEHQSNQKIDGGPRRDSVGRNNATTVWLSATQTGRAKEMPISGMKGGTNQTTAEVVVNQRQSGHASRS